MDAWRRKRAYPAEISEAADGYLIAFPDFPDSRPAAAATLEQAMHRAALELDAAIAARRAAGRPLPEPSPRGWGQVLFTVVSDESTAG